MAWTDDRVDLLRKLWTDGLSASQIAAELGGVTRNAVIGKVHRLGLSGRVKGASQGGGSRRKPTKTAASGYSKSSKTNSSSTRGPKTQPAPRPAPIVDVPEPTPLMFDLLQLTESTCKYPIGDPQEAGFGFCGHKAREGDPYCEYHCRLTYQPASDRRRDKTGRTPAQIAARSNISPQYRSSAS